MNAFMYIYIKKTVRIHLQKTRAQFKSARGRSHHRCTRRNFCRILSKLTQIGFYLPYTDWFGTASVCCSKSIGSYIPIVMVNTTWFRFDLTRFGKHFSVCSYVSSRHGNTCRETGAPHGAPHHGGYRDSPQYSNSVVMFEGASIGPPWCR